MEQFENMFGQTTKGILSVISAFLIQFVNIKL